MEICKRLYKSRKKYGCFHYFLNKNKIFHLFRLCSQRFMEKSCKTHPTVIAFMVGVVTALNDIFSIFPLYISAYLQICHWISKQVFLRTEILLFALIPRYDCFKVTYVSRLMELNLCASEFYRCIRV